MHGSAARGIAIPFAPFPFPPPAASTPVASSSALSALFLPPLLTLFSCLYPCPLGHHVGGTSIRSLSFSLSFFLPPLLSHAPTRVHVNRAYREPETKFSATSPPSMLPITRCSRDKIERPRRFSAPAATILRWI